MPEGFVLCLSAKQYQRKTREWYCRQDDIPSVPSPRFRWQESRGFQDRDASFRDTGRASFQIRTGFAEIAGFCGENKNFITFLLQKFSHLCCQLFMAFSGGKHFFFILIRSETSATLEKKIPWGISLDPLFRTPLWCPPPADRPQVEP